MSRELHRQAPAVTTRQGASAVIDALARLGARPPAKRPERANLTLTRERAQTVTCPRCHAQPGEPCIGVSRHDGQRRARKAPHVERYRAVTALLERSPP